jgi:hypothetical protein
MTKQSENQVIQKAEWKGEVKGEIKKLKDFQKLNLSECQYIYMFKYLKRKEFTYILEIKIDTDEDRIEN